MPNLFVFGSGGTGARVLKSLTMLLASGLPAGNFEVVPILIDPHESLEEQNNCKKLLKLYSDIHKAAYEEVKDVKNGFFRTPLSTLASVAPGTGIRDGFGIEGNYGLTFSQFLEKNNLPPQSKTGDFLSLLYSQSENFNKSLSMGFKGNPNVGSVVLNGLGDTSLFKAFETAFGLEDRIFIVSSIFGGTGAAGFPLLLKNLRQHTNAMIRDAKIGALTVMPYFKLTDPGVGKEAVSDIDSKNFLTKTKSALTYYISNIKNLNALYYLADPYEQTKAYKNDEEKQPDTAHLVELLGAVSILHFTKHQFPDRQQQVFEYGLKEGDNEIHFKNIGKETSEFLGPALTSLTLFNKLHKAVRERSALPFRKTSDFNARFFNDPFFGNALEDFLDHYFEAWLRELSDNQRAFNPFNTSKRKDFSHLVKGQKIDGRFLPGFWSKPFDLSDLFVNMAKKEKEFYGLNKVNKKNQYLSMAYAAIHGSIEENLSFKY
jgi:hypothetical protein